ncbi:MAG TPA: HD domain-containing phosphohydrolase [Candidatus Baltobacteraceae bacterium]|jgi:HD-GYP domain-containing protein (c-di-GMP phosphodiesterase class II)|nr:HD domain-containing phosphohydrolase [Candidatus Baltobacteraceae bacterium]
MTLFQDTGGDPRVASAQLAAVLAWYGALGDAAFGNPPGFALRKASLAVELAAMGDEGSVETGPLYFAGLLHAIGTVGNAAYRKGEDISERAARMERWDIPAMGARLAAGITALPEATPDLIRWQSECWDGTGYPDQLRWHGIPQTAQFLALADAYVRASDPEEALGAIGLQSGRAFGPENTRRFTTWFHLNAGEESAVEMPAAVLRPEDAIADRLLETIADRLDEHNGVPGRWRRIDSLAAAAGRALGIGAAAERALAIAVRVFGAGELHAAAVEDSEFDPLARLGIEHRAANAAAAAALVEPISLLREAAPIVAARSEWYDGSGKPDGLRNGAIPAAAHILAAAIACDRLERIGRLETAAGTQFDPRVARALLEAAQARA